MVNFESIQSMQKHGTNSSTIKRGDYSKDLVRVKIALANELMEKILFMASALKTYQRTVLTKYATL